MIATNHKSTEPLCGYAADAELWISAFVVPSNAPTPLLNGGPALISPWRDLGTIVVPAKARIRRGASAALPSGDDYAKVSCGNRLYDELLAGTPLALAGSASGECSTSVTPRMSASIFVAMPAFSFRNRLACSRPCPRRVSSKK